MSMVCLGLTWFSLVLFGLDLLENLGQVWLSQVLGAIEWQEDKLREVRIIEIS